MRATVQFLLLHHGTNIKEDSSLKTELLHLSRCDPCLKKASWETGSSFGHRDSMENHLKILFVVVLGTFCLTANLCGEIIF